MISRYNAVLSKCRLLKIFETLALSGTIILGSGDCGLSGMGGMDELDGLFGA